LKQKQPIHFQNRNEWNGCELQQKDY